MTDRNEQEVSREYSVAGQLNLEEYEIGVIAEMLKEVTSASLARTIAAWVEYQIINFTGYCSEAIEMVLNHRPRHAGTVSAVLQAWADAEKQLLALVQDHAQELGKTEEVESLRASAPPRLSSRSSSDIPWNGDIRSVYGKLQVWVDDRWFWLGSAASGVDVGSG